MTAARAYHEATKHTYASVRTGPILDWDLRPSPFKEYPGAEPEPLPPELELLLRWGAGVVRTRSYAGGVTYRFRTYSSAGALYPVEVYVARADGVFHFHPGDLTLRRLRSEDVRRLLADDAETVLVLTGILWRTAWKYGARGYRHLFWDAGTMLANLLALAEDARVLVAFPDTEVNRVVGVDGEREASLCLLALGHGDPPPAPEVGPPALEAAPPSGSEREHPIAIAAHGASALETADDVARWRTRAPPPATESWPHALEPVLRRRGSTREFASTPVPARKVASILARALAPIPADAEPCNELYAIVNNVEGLERGVYRFLAPERFELLRAGDFRLHAGHLALEQPLGALSAATAFFMADLDAVLARLGDRGYRWAQLEAGIRTGRAYLAAVAEGLGATASTFFDDAVSRFLAPQLSPLLCVAVGSPPARRRPRSPR